MGDDLTRTLARAKREAETPPTIFTAETRDRLMFVVWLGGISFTIIAAIVSAAVAWVSMRTAVSMNTRDIGEIRAIAVAGEAIGKKVEEEQNRRTEPLKFLDVTVRSMNEQRNYGINNDLWYRNQHGYPPMAMPTSNPTPGGPPHN